MYTGRPDALVPWFTQKLGYWYEPTVHGMVPDWALDLVTLGFKKPAATASGAAGSGTDMIRSREELMHAADAFLDHLREQRAGLFSGAAACSDSIVVASSSIADKLSDAGPDVVHSGSANAGGGDQAVGATGAGRPDAHGAAPEQKPLPQQQLQSRAEVEPGLWERLVSGIVKYKALLWRELLITTRCV